MTAPTTNRFDVPMPAGAVEVGEWTDETLPVGGPLVTDSSDPEKVSRYFNGSLWTVENTIDPLARDVEVAITGFQKADGTVTHHVAVRTDDDPLNMPCARELLTVLSEAVKEADELAQDDAMTGHRLDSRELRQELRALLSGVGPHDLTDDELSRMIDVLGQARLRAVLK